MIEAKNGEVPSLVLLGIDRVRQLATLITMSTRSKGNEELLNLAATRAFMAKALIDDVAQKELTRMNSLLQGYERDLRILGMVSIHPRLQSSGAQMSTTTSATTASGSTQNGQSNGSAAAAKPKHRTLGDYISKSKMSAVADACQRVFNELRERIERIDVDLTREPLGHDPQGRPVMLADVWPGDEEIARHLAVAADQHADLAAERHFGNIDFRRREGARVSRRSELLDEWPRNRGDAASGHRRSGDVDEIAASFARMDARCCSGL